MLYWQIGQVGVHFFNYGEDSLKNQHKKFQGRTSLFLDQMKYGNFSLKLSNVQLEDDAEYSCIYRLPESRQTKKSTIKLNVSGKIFFFSTEAEFLVDKSYVAIERDYFNF